MSELKKLAVKYEHWETDEWAAEKVLDEEEIINTVIDPCTGTGVLAEAAICRGHETVALDIHDWGYEEGLYSYNFLTDKTKIPKIIKGNTVYMNPPFKHAVDFIKRAIKLGATKIISFQGISWYTSQDRKDFWDNNEPDRIWICGSRATCWRHDLPVNEDGKRYNPETGKILSESSTTFAWFVWDLRNERPDKPVIGRIYK